MKLLLIALTLISYNQFKAEYFPDPEMDKFISAVVQVINTNTKNSGAIVWYDPKKSKDIFSPTGKSILVGFWRKPKINTSECTTNLDTKEYRCTGVKDELVFEKIPTHLVTSLKTIFLAETLAQVKLAGGNPDKWSPFLTALSKATENNNVVKIRGLGCFKRHPDDDQFEFQFSQNCWSPDDKPLLVPGGDDR